MKKLKNLKGVNQLSKSQQKTIQGGQGSASCPTIPASECISCGGFPLPNGCCLGTEQTWCCLRGNCQ